jgi:hypothetical protein
MSFPIFDLNGSHPSSPSLQANRQNVVSTKDIAQNRKNLLEKAKSVLRDNEENLRKYSRLDQRNGLEGLIQLFSNNKGDASKSLVLSNLSYSALKTSYEGWSLASSAKIYSNVCNMIAEGRGIFTKHMSVKGSSQIYSSLKGIEETASYNLTSQEQLSQAASGIVYKIQRLKVGESYSMGGGWHGVPSGHAMIYRFERQTADSFDIYIYNAQEGAEQMQGGREINGKTQTHPYMVFKGVKCKELFFTENEGGENPVIFEKLLSLRSPAFAPDSCSISDIQNILFPFHHRLVQGDNKASELFIRMQRSGNCTVKCLNCLLLDLLGSKAAYKSVSLDIRLLILMASFHSFQDNPDKDRVQLFQLKEAAANFLHQLDINFKRANSSIDEESYITACATARHILIDLKKMEEALPIPKTPPLGPVFFKDREDKEVIARRSKAVSIGQSLAPKKTSPDNKISVKTNPLLGKEAKWGDLPLIMAQLTELVDELKNTDRLEDLQHQIDATLRNLSHLKYQPSSLSAQSAVTLQKSLLDIQNSYNRVLYKRDAFGYPEALNTGMEFLALSYCLALGVDEQFGVLKNFGVYSDFFLQFPEKDRLFTIRDPVLLEQRNKLVEYFSNQKTEKIFNLDSQDFNQDDFLEGSIADGRFYKSYIQHSSKLAQEFQYLGAHQTPLHNALHHSFVEIGSKSFPPSLNHIAQLKTAALYACEAANRGNRFQEILYSLEPSGEIRGNKLLGFATSQTFWNTGPDILEKSKQYAVTIQALNPEGEFKDYSEHQQSQLRGQSLASENEVMILKPQLKESESPNHPFYLALSEPAVQTTLLINQTEEHLERLKSPAFRGMLNHMFIKLVGQKDKTLSSPFMQALKEPSTLDRFERLVKVSKSSFIDSMPVHQHRLEEMLFIIRLYARALDVTQDIDAGKEYERERLEFIQGLLAYLDQASALEISDTVKQEIELAKLGLLMGIPLKQQSMDQLSSLFLCGTFVKNAFQSKSTCEDPLFVQECKKRLFQLQEKWEKILETKERVQQFGNHVFKKSLGNGHKELKWALANKQLIALDHPDIWTIDLNTLSIRDTKGSLLNQKAILESSGAIERLFGKQSYDLKIFGNEIRFEDEKWGKIRILKEKDKQIIQKDIEGNWYTYIPAEERYLDDLRINQALFLDHIWWINSNNPQDIRGFQLKTGKEVYQIKEGVCKDLSTQKLFNTVENEDLYGFLLRFEHKTHINIWTAPHFAQLSLYNDTIEFSRFVSLEGNPLSFHWEPTKKVWNYSENSDYHIDTKFNLPSSIHIDRFLPLVDQKGLKRKVLIPVDQIESKGYQPSANIRLKDDFLDGQKQSLAFFEYDFSNDGQLIPQSLEAKIYLAHLYAAQKCYQPALDLIKTISLSETVSKLSLDLILNLLRSSGQVQDYSPNSAAIHLHAYHIFKKIDPFNSALDFSSEEIENNPVVRDYFIYLNGLNKVAQPLLFAPDKELELIEILKRLNTVAISSSDKLAEKLSERERFLLTNQPLYKHFTFPSTYKNYEDIIKPYHPYIAMDISDNEKRIKKSEKANDFFSSFESKEKFDLFCEYYRTLQTKPVESSEVQGILYKLRVPPFIEKGLSENARKILLFVASYAKKGIPPIPSFYASDEEKFAWYQKLGSIYAENSLKVEFNPPSIVIQLKEGKTNVVKASHVNVNPLNKQLNQTLSQKASIPKVLLHRQHQDAVFSKWQENYLEVAKSSVNKTGMVLKHGQSLALKKEEILHAEAIEKHVQHYRKDCEKAQKITASKKVFKKEANFDLLLSETKQELQASKENIHQLKEFIDDLVNRSSFEFSKFVQNQAAFLGEARQKPTIETVFRASSGKDPIAALQKLNPNLTETELQDLHSACIECMIESTHSQHLERIIQPLQKWQESKNAAYLEEVQDALAEKRCYNPHAQTLPLLFEYLSGLRIRSKQAFIINFVLETVLQSQNEALKSKVFQLIMAGGKTSVIISMLMEVMSEEGLISCIMCHHSQLASVKGNLALFQSKRFNKDIFVLDYTIQDLSKPEVLDLILKRINEADRKRYGIVMKTSFPQVLELKLIMESMRLSRITEEESLAQQQKLVEQLSQILHVLTEKGAGIYDESDINLSLSMNVNIPLGEKKNVLAERANLVKSIFTSLVDPEIQGLLQFEKNLQSELSQSDFDTKVIPFVANKLFENSALKLKYSPHLKPGFIRYIKGEISAEEQDLADQSKTNLETLSPQKKENILFLRYLQDLKDSSNRYENEAANLVALSQRLVSKVLRVSLSRSFNRAYGRDPSHDDGRVIPYLAVGTPATTKFGNIYMSLAYQFQAALNGGISKGEISFLAEKMAEAANFYSKKENRMFKDTLEAKQFLELTGIELDDVHQPEKLEQAYQFINDPKHLSRRMNIEAEVAPFHINYHTEYVSSNAINNASQFNRAVACSGTLWNHPTYHRKFGQAALDEGTEGSILNLISERCQESKSIHEISNLDLQSFFDLIKKHPHKQNIRALVDGAGLLRDYKTEDVALKMGEFLAKQEQEGGPKIEGVVYLHKFSQEEIEQGSPKESFVLLKKGEKKPRLLKNTSEAEIERHGVKKENLFAIFDELRATGTDIQLDENAIFLNTIDHKMPMRTYLQAALRARKAFKNQRIEMVISSKSKAEMINQGQTFEDIKDTLIKNEAIILKEQTNRARFAQIDDIIRSSIMKELLQADPQDISRLMRKYEHFLVSKFEDNPYEQYGRILGTKPTVEVLFQYAERVLQKFQETESPSLAQARLDLENLLKNFKKEIPPEEKMEVSLGDDLNATLEVEQEEEVQVEIEQESEIEVNQEVELELNQYQINVGSMPYIEESWKLDPQLDRWPQIQSAAFSVSSVLQRPYPQNISTEKYASCFPSNFWMTQNFSYTVREDIPIFHELSKQANFLLAVEKSDKQLEFVLISEKDATYFKSWIAQHPSKGIYLVDLKGKAEGSSVIEDKNPTFKEAFLEGLWYANFFQGNVEFLEQNKKLSKKLLKKNDSLMTNFLLLRTARNQHQLRKLYSSKLFDLSKEQGLPKQTGVIFSARRQAIESNYTAVQQMNAFQIAELPPEQVENLSPHQVKWLKTKEQLANLPDKLVPKVTIEQLPLLPSEKFPLITKEEVIQALQGKDCELLTEQQIKHVAANQVKWLSDEQLNLLSEKTLTSLEDPEQIKRIKGPFVSKLDEKQVNWIESSETKHLADTQIPWLTASHLIDKLSTKQALLLPAKQRMHITKLEALLALPDEEGLEDKQREILKEHFFSKFDSSSIKPWQFKYLSEETLKALKDPAIIRQFPEEWASKMTGEQAKCLTRQEASLISKLEYPAYKSIDPSLWTLLSKEQIQKLNLDTDEDVIKKLSAQQASYLTDNGLQLISSAIVNELADQDIERLTNPALLFSLNDLKLTKLTPKQVDILNGKINALIHSSQQSVDIQLIQEAEKSLNLIRKIRSTALLSKLSDSALQLLDKDQVPLLKREDFERLKEGNLLLAATASQKEWLKKEQEQILAQTIQKQDPNTIDNQYLELLSEDQIKLLTNKDKITALPSSKVKFLNSNQVERVENLTREFVQNLEEEGLKGLNTELHAAQAASFLTPKQIAILTHAHITIIQNLKGSNISLLSHEALQLIHPDQVLELNANDLNRLINPQLHVAMSENQVTQLNAEARALYKDAINQLQNGEQLKPYHVPFLDVDSPLLADPEVFAHVSKEQIAALAGKTLKKEQIQSLPVEKLTGLVNPSHIALIQTDQIMQMNKEHAAQVSLLTEAQINNCSVFPKRLLPDLPVEKLKYLKNTAPNLAQLEEEQHPHLSDEQLRTLYKPQYPSPFRRVVQGLFHSAVLVPRLIAQLAFNSIVLLGVSFLAIFSTAWREKWALQARETFVRAPARAFAGPRLITDYVPYVRTQLRHKVKS